MKPVACTAVYERDAESNAWNVRIRGQRGCQTYGRTLRQARERIREALALWLEVEPEGLEIRDELPKSVATVAAEVARARGELDNAASEAQRKTAEAVRELTDLGLSRRDAAELLGLSHKRVQQLLEAG